MNPVQVVGWIVLIIGVVFIGLGVLGLYRFKTFYERILVSSKVDTAGTLAVIFGVILINGADIFSLRIVILLAIILLVGPLSAHVVARSAYYSDKEKEGQEGDNA